MATAYAFKPVHDLPEWMGCANPLNAQAAGGGLFGDERQGPDRHPLLYQYASAVVLNAYSPMLDDHIFIGSPAMGTFGVGSGAVFVPSAGPNGTVGAGTSTTVFPLSTALPAAVGPNQLANRGDGVGFKIRIIDNAAGTTGKCEETYIVGNTGGTTPTLTVSPALSFTPANGSRYEMLSGRLFLMATAATMWKYYDVATNSFSAALTATNLTTPAVGTTMFVLDELYTPLGKLPGAGFFGNCNAASSTASTLTAAVSQPDANLQANEYANFQVRIVSDVVTPTAAGQRRKITSHTAAAQTVYTLSANWTVNPSASAVYVIEGIGDIVCMTGSAVALVHTYAAGGFRADGAWNTGATLGSASLQIPARQANTAAGMVAIWAYGLSSLDTAKNARYSAVYFFRGGGAATLDVLDIATLSWSTGVGGAAVAYGNSGGILFNTGVSYVYDPSANGGMYLYLNPVGTQHFYRFDMKNRTLIPWNYLRQPQGTVVEGSRMAIYGAVDGTTYGTYVYVLGNAQTTLYRALAQPGV